MSLLDNHLRCYFDISTTHLPAFGLTPCQNLPIRKDMSRTRQATGAVALLDDLSYLLTDFPAAPGFSSNRIEGGD